MRRAAPVLSVLRNSLVHDAHVLKDHIEDIRYYLDNYTTYITENDIRRV